MKQSIHVFAFVSFCTFAAPSMAHTALFSCYADADQILCEGGFSDGSSAANVPVRVRAADGELLFEGKIDENNEYSFAKPQGDYSVSFEGGDGHRIELSSKDIQ